jgi:thiamine-phosphate pyrophosphorylase
MTDERIGDALLAIVRGLPPGSGVVFRHLATPRAQRHALLRRVRRIAVARRLVMTVVAGPFGLAAHGGPSARSAPAHDRREAIAGTRAGAAYLFVSPVFATRSHPGAPALGIRRALAIARGLPANVIALGGMTERRWRYRAGFDGWAAIDAWIVERHPSSSS